jgi:hypothetical protein
MLEHPVPFSGPVQKFNSGSGNGAEVFQIGKALNGHVTVENRTIFRLQDVIFIFSSL